MFHGSRTVYEVNRKMAEKQRDSGLNRLPPESPESPALNRSMADRSTRCFAAELQLATIRTRRRLDSQFLAQHLASFSTGQLALSFAVEARFISIDA
jgi:hypothetical protein